VGIIPRNEGTAYVEPFGFAVSDNLEPLANRDLFGYQFLFSPEGIFLLLIDPHRSTVCVDLSARRKPAALPLLELSEYTDLFCITE
jgi:hypothetical protein